MDIIVTEEAVEFIRQKDGSARVMLASSGGGCCGGITPIPQIELGAPKELSRFKRFDTNNISIYYDEALKYKVLTVSLSKLLFMKKLTIVFS